MTTAEGRARAILTIRGRVQGVWYRASAQAAAAERGLVGWVRNEADGSVQALAEGPKEQVESFVSWCWQGPPAAKVEDVEVRWVAPEGELHGFEVVR
jgi:acylphosphatase